MHYYVSNRNLTFTLSTELAIGQRDLRSKVIRPRTKDFALSHLLERASEHNRLPFVKDCKLLWVGYVNVLQVPGCSIRHFVFFFLILRVFFIHKGFMTKLKGCMDLLY